MTVSRTLSVAVGLLLVAASAAKLFGAVVSPVARVGGVTDGAMLSILVTLETLLGVWMISGVARAGAWVTSLVTFAAFTAVSGRAAWLGQASCGCFGAIEIPPAYVLGLDFAVAVALATWPPRREQIGLGRAVARDLWHTGRWAAGAGLLAAIIVASAVGYYGSLEAAFAHARGDRLTVRPRVAHLGEVQSGKEVITEFTVANTSSDPVKVIGGTSDCACVTTHDVPTVVAPGSSVSLRISVTAPADTGALSRSVWLLTDQGGRFSRLRFEISATVVPRLDN